jgi:DNA topoisomerase-2
MAPKKTIEETYKKVTQREHILLRPDMYISSVKKHVEEMWVYDTTQNRMMKKMVQFSPGFLKIFDETLTNALDHSARDPTLDKIKLDYDKESGEITIFNTGKGIPVVEHKEHKLYVPELIFGHLLSGSNYDDKEARTGAGMNGIGIKAVNIYSKKFEIETIDSVNGLKFVQEYTDNMEKKSKPKITKNKGKSYTKVSFIPDYARFEMKGLEDDTISLLIKRLYDCIACTRKNVSIYLNGEKINGKGLLDYVKYFINEKTPIYNESNIQKIGDIEFVWEYAVVPWSQFEQVSFVNGNCTYQGGKHVDYIMYQLTNKLKTYLETKKKVKDVKTVYIKDKIFLFLTATIINPQFNSQTKELLTTQSKDFGCRVDVTDGFINKLCKSSIIEEIIEFCKVKETLTLSKQTDGSKKKKVFIPKLEDAIWAGTAKSNQCTLILTEGDSAKTFAMWGRPIVGHEKTGIFPLRGKLLNTRDATVQQLINNEEINNLKQIIGLKQGVEYDNTFDLRYGKIIILTDSDADGLNCGPEKYPANNDASSY